MTITDLVIWETFLVKCLLVCPNTNWDRETALVLALHPANLWRDVAQTPLPGFTMHLLDPEHVSVTVPLGRNCQP